MSQTSVSDTWERGSPYEQYIGRWSRQVAPRFLAWLDIPAGKRWLDVGCGTGALCAAILDTCSPSSVTGVEPSPGFLKLASQNLQDRAALHEGSAAAIPLAAAAVDVSVSGLVLNFIPDLAQALPELSRVTVPGGVVAGYVWDYADKMELIRYFWDAAAEFDAEAAKMHEGVRFSVCNPGALREAFTSVGLRDVQVSSIEVPTLFADFADFWNPFLGGQGPAPAYVMSLAEAARARLREHLRMRLPLRSDGSIALVARAWFVRGTTASDA
jgi:SAM-dependent methyltransferase